jgi:diacylglycerol kinase (ATP)
MTSVAVIAHAGKTFGGGLPELRRTLIDSGVTDPTWLEVDKSKQAPKKVKRALDDGADLVFVWGGDGMVQRCVDVLAGTGATLAIVPAGTANLFATNLAIPQDIAEAVRIGLHGGRRTLDLGTMNGEHFAVMAGTGLDALMIRDAGSGMKDRVGQLAYIWTGAKHLGDRQVKAHVKIDGATWFKGKASCVLFGNVGKVLGGMTVFPDARPDDGKLDVGVVTAKGLVEWARALGQTAVGDPAKSTFVRTATGREFEIRLDAKTPFELDGGDRPATKKIDVSVVPAAITVCVPEEESA